MSAENGMIGMAAKNCEAILTNDIENCEYYKAKYDCICEKMRSYLVSPIQDRQGAVIGLIAAGNKSNDVPFNHLDVGICEVKIIFFPILFFSFFFYIFPFKVFDFFLNICHCIHVLHPHFD